jgi:PAS domain S-box-containing protein
MNILWPEPVAAEIIRVFRDTLETGKPYHSRDFVKPRRDIGGDEAYEWELHRLTLANGQFCVICYYFDSTDLRRAEQSIRHRAEQFETLFNQAPLGVYVVDSDFRIREVNPRALPVFGDTQEFIGRDFDEVIHILWNKPYAEELVSIFRQTLATGESYQTAERSERRLDRNVTEYYEWRVDRIRLPEGGFGVVCYFRDISAQIKARAEIAESERRFRALAENLDTEVRARTSELEQRNADVLEQARKVEALSLSLMRVQDDERRHIARELHDSAGQTLAVLGMTLANIEKLNVQRNHAAIAEGVNEAEQTVRELTQELRTTSYLLHQPLLDESGIAVALRLYVEGLAERSGLKIDLDVSKDVNRLPRDIELVVFSSRTGVTHKHSSPLGEQASFDLDCARRRRRVGQGRRPGAWDRRGEASRDRAGSAGIQTRGMKERVRQLNGNVRIACNGSGTIVLVTLPIISDRQSTGNSDRAVKASASDRS